MKYWKTCLALILLTNFILRLVIFYSTDFFSFSDYQSYYKAIDLIHHKGYVSLASGNSLYAISYLGYFFKYISGNIDFFFWFNCIIGTSTTFLLFLLVKEVTENYLAGIVTAVILTLYTEYMVFSSVFYTPVLMIFLLSVFILLIYYYFNSVSFNVELIYLILIFLVYTVTFLFKPELVFFPVFLVVLSVLMTRKKELFRKNLLLICILLFGVLIVLLSGIYSKKEGEVIANDFIFFGHTDYGGDGGEGAFIYPENRLRYNEAFNAYCIERGITEPSARDYNYFQLLEIRKYITHNPIKWIDLQFKKFFRTFGIVPETTSFKILYTGLFRDKLWLTSIVVVVPVALIILMFLFFFHSSNFKHLNSSTPSTSSSSSTNTGFLYIYFTLFIYYIIATIFFGHYQERYRMPLIVLFIVPMLSYLISTFNKKIFLDKISLIAKSLLIATFVLIWTYQAINAINNKGRLNNTIEIINNRVNENTNSFK